MYPRFLTSDEEESWRDGWAECRAELRTVIRLGEAQRPVELEEAAA